MLVALNDYECGNKILFESGDRREVEMKYNLWKDTYDSLEIWVVFRPC